jgi:hypothetical protein
MRYGWGGNVPMRRFLLALSIVGLASAGELLDETRQTALNYSKWLPDLLCTEVVHRQMEGASVGSLKAQVTYFQRKESYKPPLDHLAGAVSQGEFGSLLRWIFEPDAKAEFERIGKDRVERRPVTVYRYRVPEANSRMELRALSHAAFVGFHGSIYVDDANAMVLRLTAESEPPAGFSITASYIEVEYDWAKIGGKEFLVPVRAETRMTERAVRPPLPPVKIKSKAPGSCIECEPPGVPDFKRDPVPGVETETHYRNRIEFRDYRKFTVDATFKPGTDTTFPRFFLPHPD